MGRSGQGHTEFQFRGEGIEFEESKASRDEVPNAPRGWGLGRGILLPSFTPSQEMFVKLMLNLLILHFFAALCVDYNSFRLMKFTELKILKLIPSSRLFLLA